jgi:hypothetical protein
MTIKAAAFVIPVAGSGQICLDLVGMFRMKMDTVSIRKNRFQAATADVKHVIR